MCLDDISGQKTFHESNNFLLILILIIFLKLFFFLKNMLITVTASIWGKIKASIYRVKIQLIQDNF